MSDEADAAGEQQGDMVSQLRAAVEARDAENSALRAGQDLPALIRESLDQLKVLTAGM